MEAKLDTEVRDLAENLRTMNAALSTCTQSLDALGRAEAREIARLELHQREADQLFRIRQESHAAHLEDVASVIAHRTCMETIAISNELHIASIATSLQVIAKMIVDRDE